MCGRFVQTFSWGDLQARLQEFGVVVLNVGEGVQEHPARYNIAPTQPVIVIHDNVDVQGDMKAELMRWGLVPAWVKDPREFSVLFNARSETILEKPSFRGGLRHHRCLIPASGYYEWTKAPDGSKQPHYITASDGQPIMFAGIYSTWMGPSGEELDSTAIITTASNADVEHVHDRMPVMIAPENLKDWLDVREISEKEANKMLKQAPLGYLVSHPVSKAVGSNRSEGPNLIEEIALDVAEPENPKPSKKVGAGQGELF